MTKFREADTIGNAKRCAHAMGRALKTPGITEQMTQDEYDWMCLIRETLHQIMKESDDRQTVQR